MNDKNIKILALGDITGVEACEKVLKALPRIKAEYGITLTVANGENAAQANGLDRRTAELLLGGGIDVLTSGNHIWQKKEMYDYIDENPYIVRPANYPKGVPGKGYAIFESFGLRVLVMNVLGTTYLDAYRCPFEAVDEMLGELEGEYDVSLLDVHAEATSEKLAIANCFDGKINIIYGTHTHVQTSDARIFPKGTGYLTDLGMCGPIDSILGVSCDKVIAKFRTKLPVRFETPSGPCELNGAVFTYSPKEKRVVDVLPIRKSIG